MFKLISLASPTNLFKEIVFRDGLNIILGKYSQEGKDINGIGKTSIVRMVDYCLLADGPKKVFSEIKFDFLKKHIIALKFSIGRDVYLIERDFSNKSMAYLSINGGDSIEYSDKDLRLILGNRVLESEAYAGIYDPTWYRSLMNFFIQEDEAFLKRDSDAVESFIPGNSRKPELLTLNLFLLGLDNTGIWKYDGRKKELRAYQSDRSRVEQQITEDTGASVDLLKVEIESIERKVRHFEESLSTFKFDKAYDDVEQKINELSGKISLLTKEHVQEKEKLRDIDESLTVRLEIDVDKLSRLYESINGQFAEFVKKSFKEVIGFREEITFSRWAFLQQRQQAITESLGKIKNKISELEESRSRLYKRLEEQKAFDAIKASYQSLIEERTSLLEKSTYIRQLEATEEKISSKKHEIAKIVIEMVQSKNDMQDQLVAIKEIFHELVKKSVDIGASDSQPYLNIDISPNNNSPLNIRLEVPRSGSLGKGRLEILAYDLTVFIRACQLGRELPRFLIHDGVFHGIAHKTRINLLNYLDKKFEEIPNVQYIITLNEDEIGMPNESEELVGHLDFSLESRAIAILGDAPSLMLFGSEFG